MDTHQGAFEKGRELAIEEGLHRRVPGKRRPRAEIRADFACLARIVDAVSELTARDIQIIRAVHHFGSLKEAASYLEPSKRDFRKRISRRYYFFRKVMKKCFKNPEEMGSP